VAEDYVAVMPSAPRALPQRFTTALAPVPLADCGEMACHAFGECNGDIGVWTCPGTSPNQLRSNGRDLVDGVFQANSVFG